MAVVGLDLGCLNAVMAQAERGGVTVLLNENSKRLNANMCSFQGKQRFLGEAAASIARSNYKNTVRCMKRFLGRQFREPEVAEEIARVPGLAFVEMDDGTVGVEVSYDDAKKRLSLPQCVAMMLFKLSQICGDSNKGAGIADCVLSVPAWFTNAQRLALLDAAEIAGVRCLRLMHDTTATALEYGIWRSAKKSFDEKIAQRVVFIDLGYSSYQVSVVDYVIGKLSVRATTYDRTLGGRDFDVAVAKWIAAEFKAKHKCDPWTEIKPRMKLLDAAEKAKKTLSPHGVGEASIFCECLMNDLDFSCKLSLETFEGLVQPLLDRLLPPVEAALAESETDAAKISCVEICGGGSRVASVKRVLAAKLGLDETQNNYGLKTTLNADECVSKGCAMQAAMLSPRFKVKEYAIFEAVPFGVTLSWDAAPAASAPMDTSADAGAVGDEGEDGGLDAAATADVVLFPRNAETPATKRLTFRRGEDFTITASYDAAAAAFLPPGADPKIGEFVVKGVPAPGADAQPARVRVNVSHTVHGTVAVASAQLVQEVEDDAKPDAKSAADAKGDAKGDAKAPPADGKAADGDAPADGKAEPPPADGAAADGKAAENGDEPAPEGGGGGGDKAAADGKGGEEAAPTKKKRKYKKTPLDVAAALPKMDRRALDAALEVEAQMANQDRVIQETNDMRNELEAYIYKMRDEIIGDLRPYASDDAKAALEAALAGAEEWLYEGDGYDATKSAYAARLKDLTGLGNPIADRKRAADDRPPLVAALQKKVEALKTWANDAANDATAHVDDAERGTVRAAATDAEAWLMDVLEKQGNLDQHADPVLTPAVLRNKLENLDAKTKAILNKPKPIPKKEEPKKDETKTADAPPPPAAADNGDAKTDDEPKPDVDMPDADATPSEKSDVDMPDAAPAAPSNPDEPID